MADVKADVCGAQLDGALLGAPGVASPAGDASRIGGRPARL